ncbi:uncharacterized protein LOC128174070 [Crassostrea angulata]|uniref:uncharacterized protein LOC128174070 n=1 Tax=Magallana angulata TaxID=2784310 RepID=UPI0022B0A4C4|nr:uncharacterized protein LOC128174070 [Crassostrea angulata]
MPRGKPKGNKDKGATCSGAGGGPSSLDSRTRKRRAESQLDFQQPTLSAIQVTQVPPTAVDEHQQAGTSTGFENLTTSASTWQGKMGTYNCEKLMSEFDNICTELNIPLAEDKTLGPVSVLTYLGLEIDTVNMLIKIPKPKVEILKQYVQEFLSRKSVLLKELESLVGMFNFFGKAIRSSRAFNRRFYDAMSGASEAHHHIRLLSELKDDLHMWAIFLEKFNGISYFPSREWISSDVLELFTDSTGNAELGCGAYFQGRWAFFEWAPKWHSSDIIRDMTFLELVPLVLAIRLWGQDLECKKDLFFIDNSALVSIVNKQTSKSKRVMKLVRELVLMLMQYNCIFKAKHIESSNNCIADSISRNQWGKFRQLAPEAKEQAEPIPQDFLQMIYSFK